MRQELTRLLAKIQAPGSFATRRTSATDDLRLDVKGAGRIALPIARATALKLRGVARPARYGFKDQTRLDARVRDTWEIPKSRISIDQPRWSETLQIQLDRIRRDLGLPDACRLNATLHNMLVYEPGQFFATHQDSEKTDDMIGTLVVILPSDSTGGAIVLEHRDEKVTFRGSADKLTFIAFYADCHHEVRPITRGYRVALTYNLALQGDAAAVRPTGEVAALARCVADFFQSPPAPRWLNEQPREPPDRLVYLLDHEYTRRGLAWRRLKNSDAARVAALRDVAKQLDCEIFLALADVHETWGCEGDDDDYGRSGYGRRRYRRYDEEDEEDEGSETPALIELYDSDIELRHWVGLAGRPEQIANGVHLDEVCYTKASVELEPFASEHEGYTGNAGNTVDRWYHRAAVVMWPRERTFVIRAKASAAWAIGEVAKALTLKDAEGAREMVRRLLPFWTMVAQHEEGRAFFGRTLAVAAGLDNQDLAAALLEPLPLTRLTSQTTPQLVALLNRYGLEWCRALLGRLAVESPFQGSQHRSAWLVSVPSICRRLCAGDSPHALDLARWLVAEQWTWLVKQRHQLLKDAPPKLALDTLTKMNQPILGLLESSLILKSPEMHEEIVAFLTSAESGHPVRVLAHLLRTAHEHFSHDALPGLGLKPVHAHCVLDLATRLSAPARAKDDWSIPAPDRCHCKLCGMLARFLLASDQVRFEWPLAKDQRAHIHQIVDGHDLPVSHTTRRTGRPFTLVLVKGDALFKRDAAERAFWQSELKWLTKMADAF